MLLTARLAAAGSSRRTPISLLLSWWLSHARDVPDRSCGDKLRTIVGSSTCIAGLVVIHRVGRYGCWEHFRPARAARLAASNCSARDAAPASSGSGSSRRSVFQVCFDSPLSMVEAKGSPRFPAAPSADGLNLSSNNLVSKLYSS
jgi:hypothetical protein